MVELLVSIAIVSMVGTTVILNQQDFNKSVNLNNYTHDIAMEIRTVQSDALNVNFQNETEQYGLGIAVMNFDPNNSGTINLQERFQIFEDRYNSASARSPDAIYQSGSDVAVNGFTLYNTNYDVTDLCYEMTNGTIRCVVGDNYTTVDWFGISYVRPFSDPFLNIRFSGPGRVTAGANNRFTDTKEVNRVMIELSDREKLMQRYIVLDAGGRIYTTGSYE